MNAVAAAMIVGDSGTGGGISGSRNTAGGSENISGDCNNSRKDNERWQRSGKQQQRSAVNIMNGSSDGDNVGKDNVMVGDYGQRQRLQRWQ